MSGLNDFLTGTTSKTTTLPQWYDTAQQNLVSQAQAGAAQIPQLQNTVAGTAIQNLSGANNPFLTAQNQLTQIGAGAANPWITDATTGQVSPDTSTALGGLFQAQNQQLQQTLPTLTAPAQAGAIGSGNFGSLRGQTAVDTAKANALADLYSKQMQAALQSQQTGVQAGSALGNVGSQGTSTMTTLGQAQQASPLTATADLAQILSSVKAPASVTESQQMAPLSQIGALLSGLGGLGAYATPFLNSIFGTNAGSFSQLLGGALNKAFSGSGGSDTTNTPIDQGTQDANTVIDNNPDAASGGQDYQGNPDYTYDV